MRVLAAVVSLVVARRISRPMEEMRVGAERFARGELGYKLVVPESEEMAGLAETLNLMAQQLEERIRTIVQQKNEQEAVLASMVEGVLAVDIEFRVISINKAAEALLGNIAARSRRPQPARSRAQRRPAAVCQPCPDFEPADRRRHSSCAASPIACCKPHGTALHDAQQRGIGAVIVLNDVTRFRQLENMRRDFVANVSHELKTPITSIKGFIETLLDGAMENPQDAERFLGHHCQAGRAAERHHRRSVAVVGDRAIRRRGRHRARTGLRARGARSGGVRLPGTGHANARWASIWSAIRPSRPR